MNASRAVPALAAPRGCTNFKLRQLGRRVSRHYDAALAAVGLKTSQYSLLSHIDTLGPIRPVDLAGRMALEPSTLTRNLQPLVAQGWAEIGDGDDRRSRLVRITAAGHDKRLQAQRAWKSAQLALNDRLGLERVARLHALVDECLPLLADDRPDDDEEAA